MHVLRTNQFQQQKFITIKIFIEIETRIRK
jgi:hypothetical protein